MFQTLVLTIIDTDVDWCKQGCNDYPFFSCIEGDGVHNTLAVFLFVDTPMPSTISSLVHSPYPNVKISRIEE